MSIVCYYEIVKITLKSPTLNTTKTTLKIFTKDNHTVIFYQSRWLLLLFKNAKSLLKLTEKNSALHIYFVLSILSVTLVFQCDFQCHILMLTTPTEEATIQGSNYPRSFNGQKVLTLLDNEWTILIWDV